MMRNSYAAYRQQSILTMTPGEMLTTLYDGVLKELGLAELAFEKQDWAEVNRGLQKVQKILRYMKSSLDFKYEVAKNLDALYDYFIELTIQANIRKDPAGLEEIIGFITELRDAYIQADRTTRAKEA